MSEAALQRKIVKYLRSQGCWAEKVHATRFGQAGWPDILAILPPSGRLLALEVKLPGNVPTPLQTATMERMDKAGAYSRVVWSLEDVRLLLGNIPTSDKKEGQRESTTPDGGLQGRDGSCDETRGSRAVVHLPR